MNVDRINQVIASIKGEIARTEKLGFNMNFFLKKAEDEESVDLTGRSCGIIACIAGHAYAVLRDNESPEDIDPANSTEYWDIPHVAQLWLDISPEDADLLFYAQGEHGHVGSVILLEDITPALAIRTLEHLRDTGKVDWQLGS